MRSETRLVVALALLAPSSSLALPQESGSDATAVPAADRDPLGFLAGQELKLVGRAGPSGAELRSGPDPNYKLVRTAPAGTLFAVVGSTKTHYKVLVPDGFRAYIHSKYLEVDASGHGTVTSDAVNVRSTPSATADYPIGQVSSGAEVLVWSKAGDAGDWCEVTAPAELAVWTPMSSVEAAGELDDALRSAIAEALALRERAFLARGAGSSPNEAAAAAQTAELAGRLDAVQRELAAARARGPAADYGPPAAALAQLAGEAADPALRTRIEGLQREVADLVALQEQARASEATAAAARAEEERKRREAAAAPVPLSATVAAAAPTPGAYVGFLRQRKGDPTHPFTVEQGTKVVAWLTCSSGRYRLADFANLQVEASGSVGASRDGAPVLDVGRLAIVRR